MSSRKRRDDILKLVRSRGFVAIEALARHFGVTPQTIRRDINALCAADLLARHHGGAGLPSSVVNTDYALRKISGLAEKEAIARAVAAHLPDSAAVFVASGTTMETVARALLDRSGMKVVTNNLHVASILEGRPDFEVLVTGGTARFNGGLVGPTAVAFVERFSVDYAILGCGAIGLDGTLFDYDLNEVCVMQAMMRCARRVVVAADHAKFQRAAAVRLAGLEAVGALFTDRPPPPPIAALFAGRDIELHVAPPGEITAPMFESEKEIALD